MPIVPNRPAEMDPRDELIVDIMLMIDNAIETNSDTTSYALARKIVELVEENIACLIE